MPALNSTHRIVRQTAATAVAVVLGSGTVQEWPEMVTSVLACLDGQGSGAILEGCCDLVLKLLEDYPGEMDARLPGTGKPLSEQLIPGLVGVIGGAHEARIKRLALEALRVLAQAGCQGLTEPNVQSYRDALFRLALDTSQAAVRAPVCQGLVLLLRIRPDVLERDIHSIAQYMFQETQSQDQDTALSACEFWSAYCEHQLPPDTLRPLLPALIGVLLRHMCYEPDHEDVLEAEAAEAGQEREEELRPHMPKGSTFSAEDEGEDGAGEGHGQQEEDEGEREYNLRQSSAYALDQLAQVFGDELLPPLMPQVQERLQSRRWQDKEAAILALGAVINGCFSGLMPHVPEVVSMLIPMLAPEQHPCIRKISCWTAGRYSEFVVRRIFEGHSEAPGQLDSLLQALGSRMADHNSLVQQAACSGLAMLAEGSGGALTSRLPALVQVCQWALGAYSRRSLRGLYDAIAAICGNDALGAALGSDRALCGQLLDPLLQRLAATQDLDRELIPLLECIGTVASGVGSAFDQAAKVRDQCLPWLPCPGAACL